MCHIWHSRAERTITPKRTSLLHGTQSKVPCTADTVVVPYTVHGTCAIYGTYGTCAIYGTYDTCAIYGTRASVVPYMAHAALVPYNNDVHYGVIVRSIPLCHIWTLSRTLMFHGAHVLILNH